MRKIAALLSAFALFAVACSESTPSVTDTVSRDELRIVSGEPATLDPHRVTDVGSHSYTSKLYAGLVRLDPAIYDLDGNLVAVGADITQDMIERFRRGELAASAIVVADLAEAIPDAQYNDDGTVSATFTLREDAKFFSGRAVTAYDVVYSIERAADPKTRSTTAELYLGEILGVMDMQRGRIPNRVTSAVDNAFVDLPGLEILDERTIRITMDGSILFEVFLMKLTYPAAAVVDKVQAEGPSPRWTDRPNSTGPYIIVKKDVSEIVMETNPNYHGHQPRIGRVVHLLAGGSTYLRYLNNEVDIAGVGIADLDLLQEVRDPSSELSKQYWESVDMSTSYIGLNSRQAPFDDPFVRQAFALAVNREVIARDILHNLVVPAHGILPPGMPGYRSDFQGLRYDPDKARELLAQSRYAGNMPRIKLTTSGGGGQPSIVLQSIVENWRSELGVEVEFEQVDFSTFLEDLKKGTFQMFSLGWIADYPDPEDFLDLKFHSDRSSANNETQYYNPEVDALLEEARNERDPQRRMALYHKAEDIIVNDAPWITLYHSKNSLLVKPYLCGYFPAPMAISVIQYVYFCED